MKLVIYDEYFTVTNMNGKTVWYHAEKEAIVKMKNIFREANKKQKAEQAAQKESGNATDSSSEETTSSSEADASSAHHDAMESEGTSESK